MSDLTTIDLESLSTAALDVTPEDRDWSEGWPEEWDWIKLPDCGWCDEPAVRDDDGFEWVCGNEDCEHHGEEVEDELDGGPMMNYSYALPLSVARDEDDARKIAGLPLCITFKQDAWGDEEYALALTGGGMDLSWEICEAYIRLGFLPPTHFCNLPAMSGRGSSGYRPEHDAVIVAACRLACEKNIERTESWMTYTLEKLSRL